MKTVGFSETIAASNLKVGRCRQLIEFMKEVKVISLHIFSCVFDVLCFTRPRYQVSDYRTIGPLVFLIIIICYAVNLEISRNQDIALHNNRLIVSSMLLNFSHKCWPKR